MIRRTRIQRFLKVAALAACTAAWSPTFIWAQAAASTTLVEQPDAQHTKEELQSLFEHYPPALHNVLALDPTLLGNEAYLAPYPALVNFLSKHPEVARNPGFYVGEGGLRLHPDQAVSSVDLWRDLLTGLSVFSGFALAVGLLIWLIRTLVDYRRWSRLSKVQTDVHTKLLDRFTANDDLLAYIKSPAGAKFLESSPIALDAAPRSVGAPLGRILWSVQGGVVLLAGGIGLLIVGGRVADATSQQSLQALGVLAIALGLGFVISAIVSFIISHRLGLIEQAAPAARAGLPSA